MNRTVRQVLAAQRLELSHANLLGEASGLAGDRVLRELFRSAPQTAVGAPDRYVVPTGLWHGHSLPGLGSKALVHGTAGTGKVRVAPFRAVISSVDDSTPLETVQGLRSGAVVGVSAPFRDVNVAANASGNPRWSLLYAQLRPEVQDSATRFQRDPTTLVQSSASLPVTIEPTVTLAMVNGIAAATPTRPALPADPVDGYNVALAYIWVPTGFGGSSTVSEAQIHEVAPPIAISPKVGGAPGQAANQQFVASGTVDANQSGSTSAVRPSCYLPSSMAGGVERLIIVNASADGVHSHEPGDVIDDSIDWRKRFFTCAITMISGSSSTPNAAEPVATTYNIDPVDLAIARYVPGTFLGSSGGGLAIAGDTTFQHQILQSFCSQLPSPFGPTLLDAATPGQYILFISSNSRLSVSQDADKLVALKVRDSDGALTWDRTDLVNGVFFFWLRASGRYDLHTNTL